MTITSQQVDAWDAEVDAAYEAGRQEGIKQEREACAKVCDIHAKGWEINPGQNPQAGFIATSNCAAAIRARSKDEK